MKFFLYFCSRNTCARVLRARACTYNYNNIYKGIK